MEIHLEIKVSLVDVCILGWHNRRLTFCQFTYTWMGIISENCIDINRMYLKKIHSRPPFYCQLFRWVSIPRPNSKTTGQNRMKLSTMKEYILKLCTWVLVSSCDQNWGRTTWSKMRNFNTIWSLLFRDRTPQLRGRIE